ncbi:hypothetical protein [Vibrio coralliilyticus]|uniref:hypothetical protein n=1 Tax=Vibrio coralliilyticus TaxID=190893 RepID=UPI000C162FFB|nr:hypothetical protein [Vibrio coralliilyticus]
MNRNKQRGYAIADHLAGLALLVAALIFLAAQTPKAWNLLKEVHFSWQASEISKGINTWKKNRQTFKDVSIGAACTDGSLSGSVCGDNNDGKQANIYGGDWTVTVNSSNALNFDVIGTIPSNPEKIAALADTVAGGTAEACDQASGCGSVSTTANSITMTY